MGPYVSELLEGQYWSHLILALSSKRVIITMLDVFCSHTIRQKSLNVSCKGPCKVEILFVSRLVGFFASFADLSCDVGVVLSVAIAEIGVNVVAALLSVLQLQNHSRVVVGNDISISVLGLVDFQTWVIPSKLLTRLNAL